MSSNRKCVVIPTMKEKVDIIGRLKKGETGRELAKKYSVGTSTISDIKKMRTRITRYVKIIIIFQNKINNVSSQLFLFLF